MVSSISGGNRVGGITAPQGPRSSDEAARSLLNRAPPAAWRPRGVSGPSSGGWQP